MVSKKQLDLLVSQVEDAKNKGAKIILGGNSLGKELGGAFFEPTIITEVTRDMQIWNQEVFGPVLPVVKFTNEAQAIDLANDTEYGLGSYIYTNDDQKAQRVSKQINTGMVSVNNTNYLQPSNPFGGFKASGIGRQHGKYGFSEVTQIKVVARGK